MLGYAMVSEIGSQVTLATGDRMAELETLSVAEGERGQGVGRALMDAAYAVMRELGVNEVMLYVIEGNDGAVRFYEQLGMRPYLPRHASGRSRPSESRKNRQNSGTSSSGHCVAHAADHPEAQHGTDGRPAQARRAPARRRRRTDRGRARASADGGR